MNTRPSKAARISAAISRLRDLTSPPPGQPADDELVHTELVRELRKFDTQDVETALAELARESQWFPRLAPILERVRECARLREAAGQAERLQLEGPPDEAELTRAIGHAMGHLTDPERDFVARSAGMAHASLLQELGRWWTPTLRAQWAAAFERCRDSREAPRLTTAEERRENRPTIIAWLTGQLGGWLRLDDLPPPAAPVTEKRADLVQRFSTVHDKLAHTAERFAPRAALPRKPPSPDELRASARRLGERYGALRVEP